MFLGRDTYAAKIQNSLVGTIYKKNSSVNQTVQRLLKHGSEFLIFQRKHREEGVPGRKAEIYTASFDPIFQTLQAFNVNFDKDELQLVIKLLSPANDYFPQYLRNILQRSTMRSMSWIHILASYFSYLAENLKIGALPNGQKEQIFTLLPADVAIPKDNIDSILRIYPHLPEKLTSYAIKMNLSGIGMNPGFVQALVENIPKIDVNLFKQMPKLLSMEKDLHDIATRFQQLGLKDEDSIKDFMKKFSEIEKTMERIRETDEFLKWKMEKEKKRKKKKLPKKEEPKREQKKELTWHEVFYGTK
jgi:hypothetical protein